jgi:hypothetical protein
MAILQLLSLHNLTYHSEGIGEERKQIASMTEPAWL